MASPSLDVPGRGAWRLQGGLLRLKPTSTSTFGYYRLAVAPEKAVGSAFVTGAESTTSAQAVNLGVRAVQRFSGLTGAAVDGWFGAATDKAVKAAQQAAGVAADGIVGPASMKAWLTPLLRKTAVDHGLPFWVLAGIVQNESGLDPAAVGVNGYDSGICQINADAHRDLTAEQRFDPWFALDWTANALAAVLAQWKGHTSVDPILVAVLSHNSPANAVYLAKNGKYPTAQSEDYVNKTIAAGQGW